MKEVYKKIRMLDIVTNRMVTEVFAGNYRSSFQGSGVEVEDIRQYTEEDNVKNIDWISTAKLGTPYIKKYKETRELPMFVLLDVSSSMHFTSTTKRKSDVALEVLAILIFSAIKNGESVGAILFSDTQFSFIPPKKGRQHALRILREGYLAYTSHTMSSSNLQKALASFNRSVKKHPICFLITDQDDIDEKTKKALSITNAKNDLVYIHISDPLEHEISEHAPVVLEDLESDRGGEFYFGSKRLRDAYALIRKEKEQIRSEILKKLKIDSVLISTESNIFKELFSFFKKRQRRLSRG